MKKKLVYLCLVLFVLAACAGTSAKQPGNTMKLNILHYRMPGAGESIQLCYVIKTASGEKEFFYDEIQGFKFQWGYNYVITVEKETIKNPKADASANVYRLKEIISKERVKLGEQFELPLQFNEEAMVQIDKGSCTYFKNIPIQAVGSSCDALSKSQAAIFSYNKDFTALVLVRLK